MNYQNIYNTIIFFAKSRISDPTVHYDKHHILPKSMGGTDDPTNLVNLTDREHFLVHTLLWKIHRNRSMTSALWIMSQNKRYRYKEMNSRRYAMLKEEFRKQKTDQKIYKFENIKTQEIFEGNRNQFRKYANITYSECATIIRNGYICFVNSDFNANGINWKLCGADVKQRIPHNTDRVIYEFENIFTGEQFSGTRKQFDHKISYRSYEVVNNIRIVNGWKLKGTVARRIPKNKMNKNYSTSNAAGKAQ